MEEIISILRDVALPAITAIGGWYVALYRSKQAKEKDVLDNVQQIIDIQKAHIETSNNELQESRRDRLELEKRLDLKRWAIKKALSCKYVNEDGGCPVLKQEDVNDETLAAMKCETCKYHNADGGSED